MSINAKDIAMANLPSKNDLSIEFANQGAAPDDEFVTDIRFTTAPGQDELMLEDLLDEITSNVPDLQQAGSKILATVPDVTLVNPRGQVSLEFGEKMLTFKGRTSDFKVKYSSINRQFILPKPDGIHVAFVLGLEVPVKQGAQAHNFLVLQFDKSKSTDVEINQELMPEGADLGQTESGPLHSVVPKIFQAVSKLKIEPPSPEFSAQNGSTKVDVEFSICRQFDANNVLTKSQF